MIIEQTFKQLAKFINELLKQGYIKKTGKFSDKTYNKHIGITRNPTYFTDPFAIDSDILPNEVTPEQASALLYYDGVVLYNKKEDKWLSYMLNKIGFDLVIVITYPNNGLLNRKKITPDEFFDALKDTAEKFDMYIFGCTLERAADLLADNEFDDI